MSDVPRRESPLAQFMATQRPRVATGEAGVHLDEHAFLGHLDLRGDPADGRFLEAAERVLGAALPLEPNRSVQAGENAVLWLGPNQWLVVTPSDQETALAAALSEALGDLFASVTDITGGQTVIAIGGPRAMDLLAKGCSLDLHPRVFGPGQCAQTLVAKVPVVVWQPEGLSSYRLIVRRSYADYLARWVEHAAQEYGPAVAAEGEG